MMIIIMTTIQTSQIKSGKPWLQKLLRGQAHSPGESVEMVFAFRVFGYNSETSFLWPETLSVYESG